MATKVNGGGYSVIVQSRSVDVLDDNEFFVKYIGCSTIREDQDIPSDREIDDLLNIVVSNQSQQSRKNLPRLKLTVDTNGFRIYDCDDDYLHKSFELSHISYVTTTNSWKFSKYFIFVARRGESIEGHVLLCTDKSDARRLYHIITQMFNLAAVAVPTTTERVGVIAAYTHVVQVGTRQTFDLSLGSSIGDVKELALCDMNDGTVPINSPQTDTKHDESFEDGFTQLARLRSSTSSDTEPLSPTYQLEDAIFY